MRLTRREFLQKSGLITAGALLRALDDEHEEYEATLDWQRLDPNTLERFVDPLPIPQVARPGGYRSSPDHPRLNLPYYRVEMREFQARLHRDLQPTRLWGYNRTSPGPTFETRRGHGLMVEWVNLLPTSHLLPIDHHIHGAENDKPSVRVVVHVHGAKVRPDSDGYPDDWFVPGKSALAYYPNDQDAAMLWYHDHALGITRLNIFAGLFGAFIIRDHHEDALNLPQGKYEIPLIIYDRAINYAGQLSYRTSGLFGAPWVSEFMGNAIVINGKLFPFLEIEARRYRFRIVNVSNSRLLSLSLSDGQSLYQIGSDQGLLGAPVELTSIKLAPAERADLVVDFTNRNGKRIALTNDGEEIMQFRVSRKRSDDHSSMPAALRHLPAMRESEATTTRLLTLNEYYDSSGRTVRSLLNGAHWNMPVTENPLIDSTEIWSLVNLTRDSHPIHLHLVRFQILDRRPFDVARYQRTGELVHTGAAIAPAPNEAGWKDTVRADPSMVTRIIVRFSGFTGRYVWHCHMLEHEDNEMMRPFEVLPASQG